MAREDFWTSFRNTLPAATSLYNTIAGAKQQAYNNQQQQAKDFIPGSEVIKRLQAYNLPNVDATTLGIDANKQYPYAQWQDLENNLTKLNAPTQPTRSWSVEAGRDQATNRPVVFTGTAPVGKQYTWGDNGEPYYGTLMQTDKIGPQGELIKGGVVTIQQPQNQASITQPKMGSTGYQPPQPGETRNIVPKTRTLPSEQVGSMATFDTLIKQSHSAQKLMDEFKEFRGPIQGRWEDMKSQWVATPEYTKMKTAIDKLIETAYALSGKQISEKEIQMLNNKFLPALQQPDENSDIVMQEYINWLNRKQAALNKFYTKYGYNVPDNDPRWKETEVLDFGNNTSQKQSPYYNQNKELQLPPIDGYKEGDIIQNEQGLKYVLRNGQWVRR